MIGWWVVHSGGWWWVVAMGHVGYAVGVVAISMRGVFHVEMCPK